MELLILSLTAFMVGSLHAVEPGHGKTAMAGLLFNSKNRWRDPISLSVGTASGHTLGVFIFANLSFYFAHTLKEHDVQKILEVSISLILITIGVAGFMLAKKKDSDSKSNHQQCSCCNPRKKKKISDKLFLSSVGFLIGLIPCPTAIALAVSSVGFSNQNQVLLLSLMFGLGVAVTLGGIGLLITHTSSKLSSFSPVKKFSKYGHYVSPLIFVIIGMILFSHSVQHIH